MGLPDRVARQIAEAEARIRAISEDDAELTSPGGSWSRKQLLGHLIDAAANNHVRFVRAALQNEYHGPRYEQEGWVRAHRYDCAAWTDLVAWWTALNGLIVRVVRFTPAEQYPVPCFIEGFATMSLEALIEDYLVHMNHHLDQLCARPAA